MSIPSNTNGPLSLPVSLFVSYSADTLPLKVIHERQSYYPCWTHYVYWISKSSALTGSCSVKLVILHWEKHGKAFKLHLHVTYGVHGSTGDYYDSGLTCQKENRWLWPDRSGLSYYTDGSPWASPFSIMLHSSVKVITVWLHYLS